MRRSSRTKRNRNNVHPGGGGGRSFGGGRSGGNGGGGHGGSYDRRTRPNAQKNLEKYLNLAKDAMSDGDIVQAENWYQHADHYQRVINACDEQERAMAPAPRADENTADQQYDQPQPGPGYNDDSYNHSPSYTHNGGNHGSERQQPQRYQPVFGNNDDDADDRQSAPQQQHPQRQQQRMRPQQQHRRRPVAEDDEHSLNVPFLMNAPQPIIKPQPIATAPAPVVAAAVPAAAAAVGEDVPAPRRRGRPRKNPEGMPASV